MTEWWIAPQTVGAVLVFQQNAYNFPAALLQAPKFDPAASDAANYGAIGAIVGHEVSHFVDTLGADYDAEGRNGTLVDRRGPGAVPGGDRTAGESVLRLPPVSGSGDQRQADADREPRRPRRPGRGLRRLPPHARRAERDDKDYVRQQDRQFFIGFARAWRSKIREDALRAQVATNDHAPEMLPHLDRSQPRCVVRGVRRAAGPAAVPRARRRGCGSGEKERGSEEPLKPHHLGLLELVADRAVVEPPRRVRERRVVAHLEGLGSGACTADHGRGCS